jgi:hypothetical protein
LQGVDATTLMTAAARADNKKSIKGPAEEGGGDGLRAAFKRERRLNSAEEDPHM